MDTTGHTSIAGVFRDRSEADSAVDALKLAGFGQDQIKLTEYNPPAAEQAPGTFRHASSMQRIIVHVQAEGKEQSALMILFSQGANNTDLPPGTMLMHGSIVRADAETVDLIPGQPAGEGSSDSFFGKEQVPGHPDETTSFDGTNLPHG